MRVLFTSPILEHPAAGGPQLRIENSIKALSKICELDIIHRASGSIEDIEKASKYYGQYCFEFDVVTAQYSGNKSYSLISLFEKIVNRLFSTRARKQLYDQAKFILDHVARRKIDVIWFGFGNISYPLMQIIKKQKPDLKVVCDTDSVWSRFVLREAPYAKGLRKIMILISGRRKEAEERAWVKLCDVTTAVSEVDAEYYRCIAVDSKKIHLFSNVIDIYSYQDIPSPPTHFKRPSIYLAGSFGHFHSPMDTAARWMLEEVFPRILARHPEVHFYIVGNNSEKGFGQFNGDNITVTGKLDSVLPYLCHVNVALVPLKFESGTRFKILEAGACKIPIVSTTLGAEGIPVIDGSHILIADKPEDFADSIVRLLVDTELAKKLAQNCFDLVSKQFSVESSIVEAKNILEYLNSD